MTDPQTHLIPVHMQVQPTTTKLLIAFHYILHWRKRKSKENILLINLTAGKLVLVLVTQDNK